MSEFQKFQEFALIEASSLYSMIYKIGLIFFAVSLSILTFVIINKLRNKNSSELNYLLFLISITNSLVVSLIYVFNSFFKDLGYAGLFLFSLALYIFKEASGKDSKYLLYNRFKNWFIGYNSSSIEKPRV